MTAVMPLLLAPEGSLVRIIEVRGGHGLIRRLAEIGIFPGRTLHVVTSSRGPVVIEMHGSGSSSKIALGCGVAMKILVEVS